MSYRHVAILIVLACIALALGWDALVIAAGRAQDTWCQAFRELNAASGGLLGLCFIALGVHLLCIQWFPRQWGGPG